MTESSPEHEQAVETPKVILPGKRLCETREAGRMSRDEVAHHLHLDVQIITALEEDDFDKLPSPMYVRGYLRSYARLLKLPEEEIVAAYTSDKEIDATLIPENVNILPTKKSIQPSIVKFIIFTVLVVIVVVGLLWLSDRTEMLDTLTDNNQSVESTSRSPAEQNYTPVPLTEPLDIQPTDTASPTQETEVVAEQELQPPTAQEIEQKIAEQDTTAADPQAVVVEETLADNQGDLRLVFTQDCWTEVTDSEDKRYVYRLAKAGDEIRVNGTAPFKILLGNANGVEVFYKDVLFDHKRFQRDDIAYFRIGSAE